MTELRRYRVWEDSELYSLEFECESPTDAAEEYCDQLDSDVLDRHYLIVKVKDIESQQVYNVKVVMEYEVTFHGFVL